MNRPIFTASDMVFVILVVALATIWLSSGPASPSAARSFQPAIDQHQTWRGACSAFRPSTPAAVNQLQACELGRGDASPVLSNSRSDARTSRCCIRQRVCLTLPQGHTRAYSVRIVGSTRLCGQSLRDKQPMKFARHVEIHRVTPWSLTSTSAIMRGVIGNEVPNFR